MPRKQKTSARRFSGRVPWKSVIRIRFANRAGTRQRTDATFRCPLRASHVKYCILMVENAANEIKSTPGIGNGATRTKTSVVVSRSGPANPAFEAAIDQRYNERHVKGQSEDEEGNRVKEGLVANLGDRLLNLVEWHHDREKLVASVAGRDIELTPNPGPAGHIVEAGPVHRAVLVGGDETGDYRIVHIADLRRLHPHLTVGLKGFCQSRA